MQVSLKVHQILDYPDPEFLKLHIFSFPTHCSSALCDNLALSNARSRKEALQPLKIGGAEGSRALKDDNLSERYREWTVLVDRYGDSFEMVNSFGLNTLGTYVEYLKDYRVCKVQTKPPISPNGFLLWMLREKEATKDGLEPEEQKNGTKRVSERYCRAILGQREPIQCD
ncbi:hypothetical protein KQX54_002483 [Cotesia glomerata]|uniref:Transposase n=1 Tax=Cotesia glomerata TaxID=32391 RepID=A0AAV7IHD4_COTGL|nr:hypothetical protein KQX54_002483 [Cotesia glomerata]